MSVFLNEQVDGVVDGRPEHVLLEQVRGHVAVVRDEPELGT